MTIPSFKMTSKHFLTGEELSPDELNGLLGAAEVFKAQRGKPHGPLPLSGRSLALVFEKPSLRTRVSFTVAMQELGGSVIECLAANSKKEEPEDVARVLGGYVHAVMFRCHGHKTIERMVTRSPVPIINGLSDDHHPCQILADLMTLKETFGNLKSLTLSYVGDGNNVLHSLLLLAPVLGVSVKYACPKGYEPSAFIVRKARQRAKENGASITATSDPKAAVKGANAVYTDVWASMGCESEAAEREKIFRPYQLDEDLYSLAAPNAAVLHCLPMSRGQEITDGVADHPNSVIFRQSENRLHTQKALLLGLLGGSA